MTHYRIRHASLLIGLLIALSLFALRMDAAGAAMSTGSTVTQKVAAGPYLLTLSIGPLQNMYTLKEAKAKHVMNGEVMISGTMVMGGMGGMGSPMPNHHLEVHVVQRATGKIVTQAMVSITIRSAKGKLIEHLPIAWMYGVREGVKDTHFGNNLALKNGSYQIVVQVEHTTATFIVTLGGGMQM